MTRFTYYLMFWMSLAGLWLVAAASAMAQSNDEIWRDCTIVHTAERAVYAPIDGFVETTVTVGTKVAQSDILLRYDTQDLRREHTEILSRVGVLENRVSQLSGALADAKAQLVAIEVAQVDQQIDTAQETLTTSLKLEAQGKLPKRRVDEARGALVKLQDHRASLELQQSIRDMETGLQVQELKHDLLRSTLRAETVAERIEASSVRSPVAGHVTYVHEALSAGHSAPFRSGVHVLTLADPTQLGATLALTDQEALLLRKASVWVTYQGGPREPAHVGTIVKKPHTNAWSKDTHTATVVLAAANVRWPVNTTARCIFLPEASS